MGPYCMRVYGQSRIDRGDHPFQTFVSYEKGMLLGAIICRVFCVERKSFCVGILWYDFLFALIYRKLSKLR